MSDKLPVAMRADEITPQELNALVEASDTISPTVQRIKEVSATKRYLQLFEVGFTPARSSYSNRSESPNS